jgi:hypothetical protein
MTDEHLALCPGWCGLHRRHDSAAIRLAQRSKDNDPVRLVPQVAASDALNVFGRRTFHGRPSSPVLRDEYKIEELLRQMDALRAQVAHAVKEFEQARQAVQQSAQPIPQQIEPPPATPPAKLMQAAVAPHYGRTIAEREALLARLRTRFVDENPALACEQPSVPEPRERLAEARMAVIQGRITDAERFLREAQTQVAFRPQPIPPPSIAADRIGRALDLLNVGDLTSAIQNIDDAATSAN